jgi:dGTPase
MRQDALNACMRPYGGFEHNAQSLRVVDELEDKYASFRGLNLTFECREGILKHCSRRHARELGDIGERFLKRRQPGLEAQIANLADEIAYNNHDLDDGLRAGLLTFAQLEAVPLVARHLALARKAYRKLSPKQLRHEAIRRLIGTLVSDVTATARARLAAAAPADIDAVRARNKPLVAFSAGMRREATALKRFLHRNLYRHPRVHRNTVEAHRVVEELFGAFFEQPGRMPAEHARQARAAEKRGGKAGRARIVADYIAGMTDRYAHAERDRLLRRG